MTVEQLGRIGASRVAGWVAAGLFLGWSQHAAAFLIFTDRAAWTAAVAAPITTDTFSTDIAFGASITFDTGVVSVGSGNNALADVLPDSNRVAEGRYHGRVDERELFTNTFQRITWNFPGPIFAFGGDWVGPASGGVLTLTGNFDGGGNQTANLAGFGSDAGASGFFGIVGAGAFGSITLGTRDQHDEFFFLDNLSFARVAAVSSPATFALLMLALAALGLRRRRSLAPER